VNLNLKFYKKNLRSKFRTSSLTTYSIQTTIPPRSPLPSYKPPTSLFPPKNSNSHLPLITLFTMATAELNAFTLPEITEAVRQIFNNSRFWAANDHIPFRARAQLTNRILQNQDWPEDIPIFSPYAPTHDGYSQSKFQLSTPFLLITCPDNHGLIMKAVRFRNTKFLIHRVTYRHMTGRRLPDDLEISHVRNCGLRTSK